MSKWTFDLSGYDVLPPLTELVAEIWTVPAGWRFIASGGGERDGE